MHEAAQAAGGTLADPTPTRPWASSSTTATISCSPATTPPSTISAGSGRSKVAAGPAPPSSISPTSRSGERWRLRPNEGRVHGGCWIENGARQERRLREYFAPLRHAHPGADDEDGREAMSARGRSYERLWRPLLLAGLNTEPTGRLRCSRGGAHARDAWRGRTGVPSVDRGRGLSQTFIDPALAFLATRDATIRLGERLREVRLDQGARASPSISRAATSGSRDDAAAVIAVPPLDGFGNCFPASRRRTRSGPSSTPISASIRRGRPAGDSRRRQRIDRVAVRLSGPPLGDDQQPPTGSSTVRAMSSRAEIWREAAALTGLPAELPPWRIVKEKRATFAATPAQNAKRPPSQTAVGQYRACRRLDADRPARHDRRRGAFRL